MIVKQRFELMYKVGSEVYNVVPLNESTLRAYKLSVRDTEFIQNSVKTFTRLRKVTGYNTVMKNLSNVQIVKFPMYPLLGFVTAKRLPIVNLSPLPQSMITDLVPSDVYSCYLYSIALKKFIYKKPFTEDNIMTISNMFLSIFMKFFGKRSGLTGSYSHLIPKLRFLLTLYVYESFFGYPHDISIFHKLAGIYNIDVDTMNLETSLDSVIGLLDSLTKNDILIITPNTFSTTVINYFGVGSLPLFEDISRFYSIFLASSVPGNTSFPGYLSKINESLYSKIIYSGLTALSRK